MKIYVFIVLLIFPFFAKTQVDSSDKICDSIIKNKNKYIGQPMKILFNDINVKIDFSSPDNQGSRLRGQAYFEKISLCLFANANSFSCLRITVANKVYVELEEMVARRKNGTWIRKLKSLMRNAIIVNLE